MTRERIAEIRNAVKVLSTLSDEEWGKLCEVCQTSEKIPAKSPSSNEEWVYRLMKELDIPANLKGYRYLKKAILMSMDDPGILESVTKELYPGVASYFETTMSRVERAIRHAIEHVYASKKNAQSLFKVFGHKERLTNSEFIAGICVYFDNQGI